MKENPIYIQSLWKKIWYAYKTYERKSDIPTKLMKENWLFSLNLYMNIATISQRLENWIESSDWKFWYDISKLQHGLRSGFSLVLFTVCCLYHLLFFAYNRGMGWGERGGVGVAIHWVRWNLWCSFYWSFQAAQGVEFMIDTGHP